MWLYLLERGEGGREGGRERGEGERGVVVQAHTLQHALTEARNVTT